MRYVVCDLGWCVAKLAIYENGTADTLRILSPSNDQDHYSPAESVAIEGRESILKLKAFLDQHLNAIELTAKQEAP